MPKMTTEKAKDSKKAFQLFVASLGRFRGAIIFSLIATAIASILGLLSPKILGNMTNSAVANLQATGSVDFAPILTSVIQLIVIYLVVAVLKYLENYILAKTTAHYTEHLRSRIIAKIAKLPISYFDQHQFGDTLSILSNDVDTLWNTLTEGLSQIVTNLTTVVGCLIMMTVISPLLALVAVIVVPLSTFAIAKVAKRAQKHFVSQRKILGQLNSHIEEDYSGSLIIKSNSHEAESIATFEKANQKLYDDSWKAQFLSSLAFPLVHLFTNIGYVGICMLGGDMVLKGTLLIGNVQAFIQYLSRFNQPLSNLSEIVATIQQTLAASERVFNFLNEPEEAPDPAPAKTIASIKGAVEFHDVSFSYDKKSPIIKHFSAKIEPGAQVAIVGPTGAGKTTLINLLMRFYDPDSGYITIDGVPTTEMKRSSVRALFGMVLQDTWLFSGTVKENLRYGNPSAKLSSIKVATRAAGIDHLIESMKGGYSAEISEDSDNISAGEKQLLTIARAMVENPPMMILDEATSNVDTRAEQKIQDAFEKLTSGRTSFVIAHRLSTIRNADLILVMKDGQVVEQGNHESLLAKGGFYAELYNSQFANT
ncbi:ABC transporter ATP-binding protein [Candidatus Saccharibacteria bacterium]|nr:ABC transporter ATP-binding protein [Candidatus Saccharibacteria bacterium]MBR6122859.1 ABC transporter ATP-binding protein [Candidatus Saccharibacteria bacterium]